MASGRQIRAGGAFVEFGSRDAALIRAMDRIQKRLRNFGRSLQNIGKGFAGVSAAILVPMTAAVGLFAKAGDQLDKLSRRTGFTVESLSTLGFAAEQSGSSMRAMQTAAKGLFNGIQELGRGSKTYVDSFGELGLTFEDLKNLSPEQQFKLIADRLGQIDNFAQRGALALDIFGRSGQELLPLFEEGAAGIEKLQRRARELNLEVGDDAAKEAAELTDRLNELRRVAINIAFNVGRALGGQTSDLAKRLAEIGSKVTNFVKANRSLIVTIAKVAVLIGAAGAAMFVLGGVFIFTGLAVQGLIAIIGLAGTVIGGFVALMGFVVSPVGIAVAAVAGLTAAFFAFTNAGRSAVEIVRRALGSLAGTALRAFGGVRDALAAGDIQLAVRIVWASIKLEFAKGISFVEEQWLAFRGFLVDRFSSTVVAIRSIWSSLMDFFGPTIQAAVDLVGAAVSRIGAFFTPVVDFIRKVWGEASAFVADAWGKAFGRVGGQGFDLGRALIEIVIGIRGAWVTAISSIEKAWVNVSTKVREVFGQAVGFVEEGILRARALFDDSFDLDEALKISRAEQEGNLKKISEERERRLREIDQELQTDLDRLSENLLEFDKKAKETRDEFKDQLELDTQNAGDRILDAEEELAKALRKAAEAAGRQAEAIASEVSTYDDNGDPGGPLSRVRGPSRGLFNLAALQSLVSPPEVAPEVDELKKLNTKQEKLLQTLSKRQRVAIWAN